VRLQRFLAERHGGASAAKRLLQADAVTVNGTVVNLMLFRLRPSDVVRVGKHWQVVVVDE
jgi:16S rRNA U516 pseudouridylate synthase RsuA-like enzyme